MENLTFLETVSSKGEYNVGIKIMYISSLALNSPSPFSCYLLASQMASHKSCALPLIYCHLLYPSPHCHPTAPSWTIDSQKYIILNQNHLLYSSAHLHDKATVFPLSLAPETEFPQFCSLLYLFIAFLLTKEPW